MLLKRYWLPIAATLSITAAAQAEERSATWFADHPKERAAVAAVCLEYSSQAHANVNCDNAYQGDVIAATRDAQRHVAGVASGVSNLGGSSAYWRNPANADSLAFWARQCKRAEAMHRSADSLNAMWCPEVKAAGGY